MIVFPSFCAIEEQLVKKQASYKCGGNRESNWEKNYYLTLSKLHDKMVWLDGFTQLHLFHGLLDSEI